MTTRYIKTHPNYRYWCSIALQMATGGYYIRDMPIDEAEFYQRELQILLESIFFEVIEEAVTDPARGMRLECLDAVRAKIRGIARIGAGPENLTRHEVAVMHAECVLTCQDLGIPAVAAADLLAEIFYCP